MKEVGGRRRRVCVVQTPGEVAAAASVENGVHMRQVSFPIIGWLD